MALVIRLGFNLIRLDKVDSTNNYLKNLVLQGCPHKTAVTADSQTSGRGRQGKLFSSPPGGIYISFYYNFADMKAEFIPFVTPVAAVCAAKAIEETSGRQVKIKWVNDIYYNDKKISGILTERVSDTTGFIVGIGINLSDKGIPDELLDKAGFIDADKEKLLACLLEKMDFTTEIFNNSFVFDYYRKKSYLDGRDVYFTRNGAYTTGRVLGIDDLCRLVVKTDEGVIYLDSGEVSVKPI